MDEGKMVGMILLDLQKAFDTVNHSILIMKLRLLVSIVTQSGGLPPISPIAIRLLTYQVLCPSRPPSHVVFLRAPF
ncbi:hypothetical protein DPMN_179477 [Dreissena polymorpha]|uniref:Reverse transcriptase domain-containing protein n=1 Tax=Dreissena polymorpha TaxID=45954 RepID=A0A9D4IM73_DREPO|nr:hypothetical protein DPMN_179477 [Dreissena polymorpha]